MLLKAKNIGFAYGKQTILNKINLDVPEKSSILLTGESGSGKTTFLQILGKLIPPHEGTITCKVPIGFVFQNPNLLAEFSAIENIALNHRIHHGSTNKVAMQEAHKVLVALNLVKQANNLPSQLSGGQAQRIAIARTLVTRPKIIMCDEPTGNLDQKSAKQVLDLLFETVEKFDSTLLMISHNMTLSEKFTHHFHLENGSLTKKH